MTTSSLLTSCSLENVLEPYTARLLREVLQEVVLMLGSQASTLRIMGTH
jgi:hypothetical protein